MPVIMPNATFTVRKKAHQFARDAHGFPVAGATALPPEGPTPGAVAEPDDLTTGQAYRLRVDPIHHELREEDRIEDETGRVFIVRTARLVRVPGHADVDFIRVNADLDPPKVA